MQKELSEPEKVVRGTVKRVTFRNPSNGYAVLQVNVLDQSEQITVVGTCTDVREGTNLVIRGSFITHPKFGKQLNAHSITELAPETPEAIERYLSSGLIKGIGPKTAKSLVKKFGKDTLEVIFRDPQKIATVGGIGRHKAQLLTEALAEQQDVREIMRFLVEHNISPNLSGRIYEKYKNKAIEVLTQDPYLLARDMRGVGFLTADQIAMNLGLKPDSPQRLRAGIYYALEQAADEGHCYLPRAQLSDRARATLRIGEEYDLEPHLHMLIREEYIIQEEDALYLRHLHRAEDFVADFIVRRCAEEPKPSVAQEVIELGLTEASRELNIEFSEEQRQAVHFATHYPLLVITGGPGCGKTTVIRALTTVFSRARKRILLGAPTGRAAQRMTQVTGLPASTIHRLLKYDPHTRGFLYGINQPLPGDIIIIDEASMIDIMLAKDLFSAIPADATLVLVGDKDQLPSVGPGRVFGELVSVREVKSISLSHLFRRSDTSNINSIAHMINSGIVPQIPEPDGVTKVDAYFLQKNTPEEAAVTIENLATDQLARKFGFSQEEITVLTPSNRGPIGTIELNKRLQARLHPDGEGEKQGPYYQLGETRFYLGDRVCQRVNNYNIHEAGVFNGDIGHVYSIDLKARSLTVDMWDGRLIKYEQSEVSQLSLAYALSVHRSQGSEIPCVILVLHESHFNLLERQLLYTAVTRAKRLLVVVGSRKALSIATRRMESKRRYSLLKGRIQKSV